MINILLTSSDLYYPFLQLTLYSMIKHNNEENIEFFILSDKISSQHKNMIKENENENIKINFIEISDLLEKIDLDDIQRKYLENSPLPIISRLFLTRLLPESVDKILSLDSDVLVMDSINELWNIDITDYYYAGVKDLMPEAFTKPLGLTREDNYLNTGIILVNLKKIREDKKDEKFLEFITEHHNLYMHGDQGIINGVCKEAMLPIHPKFNYVGTLHVKNPEKVIKWYVDPDNYYDMKIMEEAESSPVIYHFCESSIGRPWTNKQHKYYSLYYQHVKEVGINEDEIYDFSKDKALISRLYELTQTNNTLNKIVNILPATVTRNITNWLVKGRVYTQ